LTVTRAVWRLLIIFIRRGSGGRAAGAGCGGAHGGAWRVRMQGTPVARSLRPGRADGRRACVVQRPLPRYTPPQPLRSVTLSANRSSSNIRKKILRNPHLDVLHAVPLSVLLLRRRRVRLVVALVVALAGAARRRDRGRRRVRNHRQGAGIGAGRSGAARGTCQAPSRGRSHSAARGWRRRARVADNAAVALARNRLGAGGAGVRRPAHRRAPLPRARGAPPQPVTEPVWCPPLLPTPSFTLLQHIYSHTPIHTHIRTHIHTHTHTLSWPPTDGMWCSSPMLRFSRRVTF
jgi:hypothetical protein